MDKKDRNSWLMAVGGAAVVGASVAVSRSSGVEMTSDTLEIIESVLKYLPVPATIVSAIGLVRLVVKHYGQDILNWIKRKTNTRSKTSNQAELSHVRSKSYDSKSSSHGNTKEGEMVDVMKRGFNRGASINNPPRYSARNPVNRNVSKVATPTKQTVR